VAEIGRTAIKVQ